MPRTYETVLIFDSSLDDGQVEERIARYRRILVDSDDGGSVDVDLWGKRKLAYPIGKKEQGIYAVLRYQTEPGALTEFERVARLDEQVLRHLTVVNPVGPPAGEPVEARAAAGSRDEEE